MSNGILTLYYFAVGVLCRIFVLPIELLTTVETERERERERKLFFLLSIIRYCVVPVQRGFISLLLFG